jgi:flagellar biosynthesis/type III secretory pathway protein FliH
LDKNVDPSHKLFLEDFGYRPQKIIQIYNDEDIHLAKEHAFEEGQRAGYENGYEEGRAMALTTNAVETASLLQAFNEKLDELITHMKSYNDNYAVDLFDATYAIFKKVLPYYIEKNGKGEIHSFIDQILKNILKKQEISIKVKSSLQESITEFLKSENVNLDYINISAEDKYSQFECAIEWVDGGASLNIEELYDLIECSFKEVQQIADEKK